MQSMNNWNIYLEGRTTLHHITPLLKLSSEMRKTLTDKISTLSEKISVLNDMSKDAWKELSELEEDAKKMITILRTTQTSI